MLFKNRISIFSFLLFLFLTNEAHAGITRYVSPTGDDRYQGTQLQPYATLQKAADEAREGDTIKVLEGVYIVQGGDSKYPGMVRFSQSGTQANPITFEAVGNVTVRGDKGVWDFGGIFEITSSNVNAPIHDLVIRGFRFENSAWFGISVSNAQRILLEGNSTFNTGGSGIRVGDSRDITAKNNTIEKACQMTDKAKSSQEVISFSNVNGFEIANNHVFNSGVVDGADGGEGIDAKGASSNGSIHHNRVHDLVRLGIYVDSWDRVQENVSVYNNTVYATTQGIVVSSENGGTARGIKIFNNLVSSVRDNGIVVSTYGKNGPREDIQIINNTVFYNGYTREGLGTAYTGGIALETANAKNILIRNNLVSQNNRWQIRANSGAANVTIDNNLIDGFRGFNTEVKGVSVVETSDPRFVDPRKGDLHLLADSPARYKGNPDLAPRNDYDGVARSQGSAVDIGAYQFPTATR